MVVAVAAVFVHATKRKKTRVIRDPYGERDAKSWLELPDDVLRASADFVDLPSDSPREAVANHLWVFYAVNNPRNIQQTTSNSQHPTDNIQQTEDTAPLRLPSLPVQEEWTRGRSYMDILHGIPHTAGGR